MKPIMLAVPGAPAPKRRRRKCKLKPHRIPEEFETAQAVAQARGLIVCDAWYARTGESKKKAFFPM